MYVCVCVCVCVCVYFFFFRTHLSMQPCGVVVWELGSQPIYYGFESRVEWRHYELMVLNPVTTA